MRKLQILNTKTNEVSDVKIIEFGYAYKIKTSCDDCSGIYWFSSESISDLIDYALLCNACKKKGDV